VASRNKSETCKKEYASLKIDERLLTLEKPINEHYKQRVDSSDYSTDTAIPTKRPCSIELTPNNDDDNTE
jgi:hypothetical protein